MPAAALIGQVVWSSDGVLLGVVSAIAGTALRLALVPDASLDRPGRAAQVAMPASPLGTQNIRLSVTAAELARVVPA